MRTSLSIVVFLFLFALAAAAPVFAAASEPGTGFVGWALDKSDELDLRWSRMTGIGAANTSGGRDGAGVATARSFVSGANDRGTALSHAIITSHSLPHKVTMNSPLLPLSTRPRNGAARGVSRLQSPAQARLSLPYAMKRPLNSSIQQRNFFHTFGGSVARPKLKSFGRISRTAHRFGGAVSRPSGRVSRPRIL
jgi:hypothetical protein